MSKRFLKIRGQGEDGGVGGSNPQVIYSDEFSFHSFLSESLRGQNAKITPFILVWRSKKPAGNAVTPNVSAEVKIIGGPEDGYEETAWVKVPNGSIGVANNVGDDPKLMDAKEFPIEGVKFRLSVDAGNNASLSEAYEFTAAIAA